MPALRVSRDGVRVLGLVLFGREESLRRALPTHEVAFQAALLRVAGLLQGLQSLALFVLVLDRARRRAEFTRAFNQTLLDGMDVGLALIGPDLRIQHTNRWMTERFGSDVSGRACVRTYLARPDQCAECPWHDDSPCRCAAILTRAPTLGGTPKTGHRR